VVDSIKIAACQATTKKCKGGKFWRNVFSFQLQEKVCFEVEGGFFV
jgi:hypothetical protein